MGFFVRHLQKDETEVPNYYYYTLESDESTSQETKTVYKTCPRKQIASLLHNHGDEGKKKTDQSPTPYTKLTSTQMLSTQYLLQ
jgi:hypothetical protein